MKNALFHLLIQSGVPSGESETTLPSSTSFTAQQRLVHKEPKTTTLLKKMSYTVWPTDGQRNDPHYSIGIGPVTCPVGSHLHSFFSFLSGDQGWVIVTVPALGCPRFSSWDLTRHRLSSLPYSPDTGGQMGNGVASSKVMTGCKLCFIQILLMRPWSLCSHFILLKKQCLGFIVSLRAYGKILNTVQSNGFLYKCLCSQIFLTLSQQLMGQLIKTW